MIHAHINIGSNLGNREDNIRRAVAALQQLAFSSFKLSDTFSSSPWGYSSTNDFLNVGISFDCNLSPEELLGYTQSIEQSISNTPHRNSDGSYADRVIDIDIIACAKLKEDSTLFELIEINTEKLTLPHPRALLRDFVTIPLQQIDPQLYNLLLLNH
ncbi:MAG: 2-amino-4-hydroxy-6-hydroxymethyldihydropteridine diphosphokinase [Muribaculaceae bacterium]|nr:2-amino-4-hydroxy-6-hydroxymethyldihydropteridine diphosphokinase [Muribaculaceae bacterium]